MGRRGSKASALGKEMKETGKTRIRPSQVSPPESGAGFSKIMWGPQEQAVFGHILFLLQLFDLDFLRAGLHNSSYGLCLNVF